MRGHPAHSFIYLMQTVGVTPLSLPGAKRRQTPATPHFFTIGRNLARSYVDNTSPTMLNYSPGSLQVLWAMFKNVVICVCLLPLTGCSAVKFTCGSGEFGPRAALVSSDVSPELIENLSRLCSTENE